MSRLDYKQHICRFTTAASISSNTKTILDKPSRRHHHTTSIPIIVTNAIVDNLSYTFGGITKTMTDLTRQ
jgi:hypothetical protein